MMQDDFREVCPEMSNQCMHSVLFGTEEVNSEYLLIFNTMIC